MSARISYLVGRLDRLLRRALADALQRESLSLAEYTTLSVLDARAGLSNAQLARRSLITPQAMNEVLARLEERKLVRRSPEASHGRSRPAALTRRGEQALSRADAEVAIVEQRMVRGISTNARKELRDLLVMALHNLEDSG